MAKRKQKHIIKHEEEEEQIVAAEGVAKPKQKHVKKQKELIVAAEKSTLRSCSSHHKSRSTDDGGEDATLLDQPAKKPRASATYGKGDDESKEAVKNINYEEYNNYFKSFNSEVAKSVGGTMGELYKGTYRGVVRVTVVIGSMRIKIEGNAFVICKKKRVSILLTCAHIFPDSESLKYVYVVTSDFKFFIAKVWHISKGMDICLLIVNEEMGSNVVELKTWCDEVNFMEDIFSISCPLYKKNVTKVFYLLSEEDLTRTLWFTLTKGYVSHPFLVGNHPRNLDGIFFQMHGCNWGESSWGAPILSMKGKAIGMYVGSSSDSDALNVKHWALRLNSVRDYLEKIFKVPEKEKGRNSLKNMVWSSWKDIKAKRRESIVQRYPAKQQSLGQPVKKISGLDINWGPRKPEWLQVRYGFKLRRHPPKAEERPFRRGRTIGMNKRYICKSNQDTDVKE